MEATDIKMEDENQWLKQMFADLSLEDVTENSFKTSDEPVIQAHTEMEEHYQQSGFKKLFQVLRRQRMPRIMSGYTGFTAC